MHRKNIRIISLMLTAVIAASAISGCNKKKEETPVEQSTQQASVETTEGEVIASGGDDEIQETVPETEVYREDPDTLGGLPVIMGVYEIGECISFREMDSIDYETGRENEPEYEDAELDIMLRTDARPRSDADLIIEPGDYVNVNITAYVDGEINENISRKREYIRVGAGSEEEEIEKALIGTPYKGTAVVEKTYSEEENTFGLGGETVRYEIKVNSVARPPKPTETEVMRRLEEMQEQYEAGGNPEWYDGVWEQIRTRAEISAYPEKTVRQARAQYEKKYLRGEKLEDYLNSVGMTRAEFKKIEDDYAVGVAKDKLIILALQEETGINEDSDEYKRRVALEETNPDDPDLIMKRVLIDRLSEEDS